jgi:hypothetical protein
MGTKILTFNNFIIKINDKIISKTIEIDDGNFIVYATDNDKIITSDNDILIWE